MALILSLTLITFLATTWWRSINLPIWISFNIIWHFGTYFMPMVRIAARTYPPIIFHVKSPPFVDFNMSDLIKSGGRRPHTWVIQVFGRPARWDEYEVTSSFGATPPRHKMSKYFAHPNHLLLDQDGRRRAMGEAPPVFLLNRETAELSSEKGAYYI